MVLKYYYCFQKYFMNLNDWLDIKIFELTEKAKDVSFVTNITENKVFQAKEFVKMNVRSTDDLFVFLASVNLLNSAIKKSEFKKKLSYSQIKGSVSRLLNYLITINNNKFKIDFYISPTEYCVYIDIYKLQFSFHNIGINETIKRYIESEKNVVKTWKEIRLQKIAGELFDLSIQNKLRKISTL
jgi:hypothetical protein